MNDSTIRNPEQHISGPGGRVRVRGQVNPEGSRRRYAIRRDHELVRLIKDRLDPAGSDLLQALLDLVERTVPVDRVWLDVTERGVPADDTEMSELVSAALSTAKMMERAGVGFDEAAAKIAAMDPFDKIENLAKQLVRKGKGKNDEFRRRHDCFNGPDGASTALPVRRCWQR